MPKKKASKLTIPPGAEIYGTVTETISDGIRKISVHGEAGIGTGILIKRGHFEKVLPSATIVNVLPGPVFVAWDGIDYKLCHSLREIQADDNLTLIGSLEDIPSHIPPSAPYGRPPLDPLTCEAIDQLLHKVDERHWPLITAMRVKKYYPPDTPVPSPAPHHLLGAIRWYATTFFGSEADQYDQFRQDRRYPAWLSHLAERTIAHVWSSVERLETWDSEALLLTYHCLTKEKIEQELKKTLSEIGKQYEQGMAPSQVNSKSAKTPPEQQPSASVMNSDSEDKPEPESIASKRKAAIEPILEEKGWSVLDWATESEVAYHTAADFLAGRTRAYRSTRVKLAKSIGLSIQQFPR